MICRQIEDFLKEEARMTVEKRDDGPRVSPYRTDQPASIDSKFLIFPNLVDPHQSTALVHCEKVLSFHCKAAELSVKGV